MNGFTAEVAVPSAPIAGGPDVNEISGNRILKEVGACRPFLFLKGGVNEMEDTAWRSQLDQEEDTRICPNCGYTYIVVEAKEPVAKYGFGYIQCLSCNMFTEI